MLIIRISTVLALLMFGILLLSQIEMVTAMFRSFVFFVGIAAILTIGRSLSRIVSSRHHQGPNSQSKMDMGN